LPSAIPGQFSDESVELNLWGDRLLGAVMAKQNWRVSVVSKVDARFAQKSGPNKPGTDCTVSLRDSSGEQRVLVRIYADNVSRGPNQAKAVTGYIGSLLQSGWTPAQYTGEPGELVVPMRFQVPPNDNWEKPWWRFWWFGTRRAVRNRQSLGNAT
jgi:hypothetical protein